jgi:hypothetical protein
MKVGDLIFDSSLGMKGLVVGRPLGPPHEAEGRFSRELNVRWIVLYEDGMTDGCYANEAEVINESR